MSDVLISDVELANDAAAQLHGVDLSDASQVTYPAETTVSASVEGASLGNSLKSAFELLQELIELKAENVQRIAQAFVAVDASLDIEVDR